MKRPERHETLDIQEGLEEIKEQNIEALIEAAKEEQDLMRFVSDLEDFSFSDEPPYDDINLDDDGLPYNYWDEYDDHTFGVFI